MAEDTGTATRPAPTSPSLAPDLEGLQRNYLIMQGAAGKNIADLDAMFALAQSAAGAKVGAAGAVARAQIDINNVVETAAIKLKKDNAEAAVAFGTNPDASTYVIHDLGAKIRQSITDEEAKRTDLQGSLDASFFDNPADWLLAQVAAPFQAASLELAEGRTKRLSSSLAALQNLTLEQYRTNEAIDDASSTELLAAKNRMALASAAGAAASSQAELARLGIEKINIFRSMNAEQFNATIHYNNEVARLQTMSAQARELELREDTHRMQRENHEIKVRHDNLMLSVAEGKDEASKDFQARLDRAAPLVGIGKIGIQEFNKIPDSAPLKQAIIQMMYSTDGAAGRLGASPAQAYGLSKFIGISMPGLQDDVRNWTSTVVDRITKGQAETWKNLDPAVKDQKLNEAIRTEVKKELELIPQTGGLYSPPPLAAILNNPLYKDNMFAKELAELGRNPTYATKPEDFFVVAMKYMQANPTADGRFDPKLASILANNIAFIFQGVMVGNNITHQYGKFVLPGLSDQTGFKMQARTGSLFNGTTAIDMSNHTELTAYLIRRMATEVGNNVNATTNWQTPGDIVMPNTARSAPRRTQ